MMMKAITEGISWALGTAIGFTCVAAFWLLGATCVIVLFDLVTGARYFTTANVGILALVLFIGCMIGKRR